MPKKATGHKAKTSPASEKAPAWATALVERIDKLEQTVRSQAVSPAAGSWQHDSPAGRQATANGGASTWQRCAECGDKFEGPRPPFGSAALCPVCIQPGHKLVQCASCNKAFSIPPGASAGVPVDELICAKCEGCFLCGTKATEEVCARCIKKGARVCDACLRLARAGSAFCDRCDKEYRGKSAEKFEEPQVPVNTREDYGSTLIIPPPGAPLPPALAGNPPATGV